MIGALLTDANLTSKIPTKVGKVSIEVRGFISIFMNFQYH